MLLLLVNSWLIEEMLRRCGTKLLLSFIPCSIILEPIPWSLESSGNCSSFESRAYFVFSSLFDEFLFLLLYVLNSSCIFDCRGWWELKMYIRCFDTEDKSRFGSSSREEAFPLKCFRIVTTFFFKIVEMSVRNLVWAKAEFSEMMGILVGVLHHFIWTGCTINRTESGRDWLFSSALLWCPQIGQTGEVNSEIKVWENK